MKVGGASLRNALMKVVVVTVILGYFKQILAHIFGGGEPNAPIRTSTLLDMLKI